MTSNPTHPLPSEPDLAALRTADIERAYERLTDDIYAMLHYRGKVEHPRTHERSCATNDECMESARQAVEFMRAVRLPSNDDEYFAALAAANPEPACTCAGPTEDNGHRAFCAITSFRAAANLQEPARDGLDRIFSAFDKSGNVPMYLASVIRDERARLAPPSPADPEEGLRESEGWDEADNMCPNCITPWKCNGPHLSDETVAARRHAAANPEPARDIWTRTPTNPPPTSPAPPPPQGPPTGDGRPPLDPLTKAHDDGYMAGLIRGRELEREADPEPARDGLDRIFSAFDKSGNVPMYLASVIRDERARLAPPSPADPEKEPQCTCAGPTSDGGHRAFCDLRAPSLADPEEER